VNARTTTSISMNSNVSAESHFWQCFSGKNGNDSRFVDKPETMVFNCW